METWLSYFPSVTDMKECTVRFEQGRYRLPTGRIQLYCPKGCDIKGLRKSRRLRDFFEAFDQDFRILNP